MSGYCKIRVSNDEPGKSNNSWGIRLLKGQWIISAIINDAFHKEYVESSEQTYQEFLSHVDNLDEFKQAAQRYELELDERIIYEKIIDLEFLLGYDINIEC